MRLGLVGRSGENVNELGLDMSGEEEGRLQARDELAGSLPRRWGFLQRRPCLGCLIGWNRLQER